MQKLEALLRVNMLLISLCFFLCAGREEKRNGSRKSDTRYIVRIQFSTISRLPGAHESPIPVICDDNKENNA